MFGLLKTTKKLRVNAQLVIVFAACVFAENDLLRIEKRSFFIFPNGGLYKLIMGLAIPVKLGLKQSMAFGLNLQFQFPVARNHSEFENYPPIISKSQEKRQTSTNDRALAYLFLESLMNRYGVNGRACILRSICENATNSLNHEANGLYGHLIHIVLTPNYGYRKVDPSLEIYLEAQRAGEYGVNCFSLYSACPHGDGILDFMSLLEY